MQATEKIEQQTIQRAQLVVKILRKSENNQIF